MSHSSATGEENDSRELLSKQLLTQQPKSEGFYTRSSSESSFNMSPSPSNEKEKKIFYNSWKVAWSIFVFMFRKWCCAIRKRNWTKYFIEQMYTRVNYVKVTEEIDLDDSGWLLTENICVWFFWINKEISSVVCSIRQFSSGCLDIFYPNYYL